MKILIADDHEYNRDLLNFILQDEGHETLEAQNGAVACEKFEEDLEIDIILMDVNMPEMDGLTATKNIKKSSKDRFVPIIFITALDDSEMLSKCLDAGGDDFVSKPINEAALIAKINAHARTRNLYNELQSANKTLEYHSNVMQQEHAIVEHVFAKGSQRMQTVCDNVLSYTSPMSMFNGDIVMQSPSPSGGVYVLLGDFTGHGLAASIGTLPVSEIFFSYSERQASISQIAQTINSRLYELLPSNMFLCATIAYLDYKGESLTIWSGGMNDMLISKKGEEGLSRVLAAHMPLAILDDDEFDDGVELVELEPESKVYIYSDGINEAANSEGEEFGLARLEKMVAENDTDVVNVITDTVHEFQKGSGQSDDLSIIELVGRPVVHRDKDSGEETDVAMVYHATESFPWNLSMKLEGDSLKNTNIVTQIMGFVASIQGIQVHQDKIFIIVSELYSNALEHGVLGLESSLKESADGFEKYYQLREERLDNIDGHFIDLNFRYIQGTPNKVELVLTDSGTGFDVERVTDAVSKDEDSHGRGLGLLQNLCAKLDYSNGGRTVTAVYEMVRS